MLEKLKDIFAYEAQFTARIRSADLHSLVLGNRVSELFGQSPSFGCGYNVEKFRNIFYDKYPKHLYWGKNFRRPSRAAAFKFIIDVFDTYCDVDPDVDPKRFAFNLELASLFCRERVPEHWQKVIDESKAIRVAERRAEELRMLSIMAARQKGMVTFQDCFSALDNSDLPGDVGRVWNALSFQPQTEFEISQLELASLDDVCCWLPVLVARELVGATGTALAEPKYYRLQNPPKHPKNFAIWESLNTQLS
jgi:hypothetical protein